LILLNTDHHHTYIIYIHVYVKGNSKTFGNTNKNIKKQINKIYGHEFMAFFAQRGVKWRSNIV